MLAHTTRALQLLFETVAEVDTLQELARVGTIAVELYEGDDAVLRELMQAIEARATAIREQLRLFPATPAEVQPDVDLEPASHRAGLSWPGSRDDALTGAAPVVVECWCGMVERVNRVRLGAYLGPTTAHLACCPTTA